MSIKYPQTDRTTQKKNSQRRNKRNSRFFFQLSHHINQHRRCFHFSFLLLRNSTYFGKIITITHFTKLQGSYPGLFFLLHLNSQTTHSPPTLSTVTASTPNPLPGGYSYSGLHGTMSCSLPNLRILLPPSRLPPAAPDNKHLFKLTIGSPNCD